jgi:hypothetical protein
MGLWTRYSPSALCRVQSGRRVPGWGATRAFVSACDGDEDWWLEQYAKLLAAVDSGALAFFTPQRPTTSTLLWGKVPQWRPQWMRVPFHVRGITEFSEFMHAIWKESGLTLGEIAARTTKGTIVEVTDKPDGVAVSTLSDLCNPACTSIPTWRTLFAFLMAVGVDGDYVIRWEGLRSDLALPELVNIVIGDAQASVSSQEALVFLLSFPGIKVIG